MYEFRSTNLQSVKDRLAPFLWQDISLLDGQEKKSLTSSQTLFHLESLTSSQTLFHQKLLFALF
jgi:hypothetical protein